MCNPLIRSALRVRAFAAVVLLTCSLFATAHGRDVHGQHDDDRGGVGRLGRGWKGRGVHPLK